MTAAIKRMLAERQRLAEGDDFTEKPFQPTATEKRYCASVDSLFGMIDLAAPFMDEGCDPEKWRPSDKLKLYYCVIASGPNPRHRRDAAANILTMLDKARLLWTQGRRPDPWAEDVEGMLG